MNNSTQQNPSHLYIIPGTYSVSLTAITTDGCQRTTIYNNIITVYPNPIADFIPEPSFGSIEYPYITFIDRSVNAYTWFWNFGDPSSNNNYSTLQNPTHKFSKEGNFLITLTVESPHGCTDSTSGIIRILPAFSIYIPNAFTPNGDGINDGFKAYGTNIAEYLMYIFDRWGKIMFETDNINEAWDGHSSKTNEPLMQDVYVYKIIAKDIFGKEHQYIGRVTLLISR
jgi:gliding motility-associated-like protein